MKRRTTFAKPQKRRKKLLLWCIGLLLFYTISGFFIAPPIVRSVATKKLREQLGRDVSIERVKINPYALSVTVRGLLINELDRSGPFVAWDEVYANLDLAASIFGKGWKLSEIRATKPYLHVVMNKDGSFNFSDLLSKFLKDSTAVTGQTAPSKSLLVRVGKIRVENAQIDYDDRARAAPFKTTLGPTDLALENFSTQPDNKNPYSFEAVSESGEKFVWSGNFLLEPLRSSGEFTLTGIKLKKYAPFYSDRVNFDIRDGSVDVRAAYDVTWSSGTQSAHLSNAAISVQSLKISEQGSDEIAVEVPSAAVAGADIDVFGQRAEVATVATSGGKIAVRRAADGAINLLELSKLPPAPAAKDAKAAADDHASWAATVKDIRIADYAVTVDDFSNARPAKLSLDQVAFGIQNVTTAKGAQMPLTFSLRWNGKGSVKGDGTASIIPIAAELNLALEGIELRPVDPYLDKFAKLFITDGEFGLAGRVRAEMPDGAPMKLSFEGDAQLDTFATTDGMVGEDFVKLGSLRLSKMKLQLEPMSVEIAEVSVSEPYCRLIVGEKRDTNLGNIIGKDLLGAQLPVAEKGGEKKVAAAKADEKPFAMPQIKIGAINLTGGSISCVDRSVQPHVFLSVAQINGKIANLTSEELQRADVNISAKVNNTALVEIAGNINPLAQQKPTDLTIKCRDVDLVPTSPYSGKFLGFTLVKGKVSVDLKYVIQQRNLDATNLITIDQLTLGEKTNSPDATKLPVKLGIAVLKDRDGKMELDVPVKGNLDDPEFGYSKVVWHAIINVFTKIITSPFSVLGAMFGGGGEELSFLDFEAGSARLPKETKKLEVLVKALNDRPALQLEIEGTADPAIDADALKRQKLEMVLRTMKFKQARQKAGVTPEQLTLEPEEYSQYLRLAYYEARPKILEMQAAAGIPSNEGTATAGAPSKMFSNIKKVVPKVDASRPGAGTTRPAQNTSKPAVAQDGEVTVETMESALFGTIEITTDDLRSLSSERAKTVMQYLVEVGKVEAQRAFLVETPPETTARAGSRVYFNLK